MSAAWAPPGPVAAMFMAVWAAPSAVPCFQAALAQIGYDSSDAHLYSRRWRLRDIAALIPIVDGAPRLTPDAVAQIGARFATDRIGRIVYTINVEGLGFTDGTPQFHAIIPPVPGNSGAR